MQLFIDRLILLFVFNLPEQAWAMLLIALDMRAEKLPQKNWKTSNDFQKSVSNLVAAYRKRKVASTGRFLVYQYGLENLLLVENLQGSRVTS